MTIKQIVLRVEESLHKQLKLHSVLNDIAMNEFIKQAVQEKLEKEKK